MNSGGDNSNAFWSITFSVISKKGPNPSFSSFNGEMMRESIDSFRGFWDCSKQFYHLIHSPSNHDHIVQFAHRLIHVVQILQFEVLLVLEPPTHLLHVDHTLQRVPSQRVA